jgi:hypothetical protein
MNVFPELKHNEMQGLDALGRDASLWQHLSVLLVRDEADHTRIRARMDAFEKLMGERNIPVHTLSLSPGSRVHTTIRFWVLMRIACHEMAATYGVEPDTTPLIEAFKKLI